MPSESALQVWGVFFYGYDQLQAKDMLMVMTIVKNKDLTTIITQLNLN